MTPREDAPKKPRYPDDPEPEYFLFDELSVFIHGEVLADPIRFGFVNCFYHDPRNPRPDLANALHVLEANLIEKMLRELGNVHGLAWLKDNCTTIALRFDKIIVLLAKISAMPDQFGFNLTPTDSPKEKERALQELQEVLLNFATGGIVRLKQHCNSGALASLYNEWKYQCKQGEVAENPLSIAIKLNLIHKGLCDAALAGYHPLDPKLSMPIRSLTQGVGIPAEHILALAEKDTDLCQLIFEKHIVIQQFVEFLKRQGNEPKDQKETENLFQGIVALGKEQLEAFQVGEEAIESVVELQNQTLSHLLGLSRPLARRI